MGNCASGDIIEVGLGSNSVDRNCLAILDYWCLAVAVDGGGGFVLFCEYIVN